MNLFELQKLFTDSKLSLEQSFKILMDEFLKQQVTIDELTKQLGETKIKNDQIQD